MEQNSTRKFIFLCIGVIVAGVYAFAVTFGKIPKENREIANLVLGVFLGTCIKDAYNFLFGSTESSKQKDATIQAAQDNIKNALAATPAAAAPSEAPVINGNDTN